MSVSERTNTDTDEVIKKFTKIIITSSHRQRAMPL